MKYIDADDLAARLIGDKYKVFREILQSEQEAIVRCENCRNYRNEKLVFYLEDENTWVGFCEALLRLSKADGFCSYGERKEE